MLFINNYYSLYGLEQLRQMKKNRTGWGGCISKMKTSQPPAVIGLSAHTISGRDFNGF